MDSLHTCSFLSSELLVRDVAGEYRPARADEVLHAARALPVAQMCQRDVMDTPATVRDFLRMRLGGLAHEMFAVLMLDAKHGLIEFVELFRGILTQTSVYPREVAKESLARNAAALILVEDSQGADVFALAFTVEEVDHLDTRASSPSNATFAITGEMTPACGVPARVANKDPPSTYPASNHLRKFALCIGTCDPGRSGPREAGNRVKPEEAHRTGRVAHLKREVFARVFDVPLPSEQALVFVEPQVIERIQATVAPAAG